MTYLVETADPDRRGISGSWANSGSIAGMLLGSAAAAAVNTWFPQETLQDWAWRLPFLFGGLIGGISILLRRKLPKSEHFKKHHAERGETSPLLQAFNTNRKEMIQAILFASCYGVIFYLSLVYLPEWLHNQMNIDRDKALLINTGATALLLILIPVSGWLSDRFFRRTHFIAGAMLLTGITAIPLYSMISDNGLFWPIIVQVTFIIFLAVSLGSAPALFVELFPSSDRLSGYSVAYNLGLGVVGGATPMFATWLIDMSNITIAPSIILSAASILAFISMLWIKDRSREALL